MADDSISQSINFNQRTRKGCDGCPSMNHASRRNFNQRTRKGCDLFVLCNRGLNYDFNQRTRKGCDMPTWGLSFTIGSFQSAHPQGVRLTGLSATKTSRNISISAPARGATLDRFNSAFEDYISISAPARGATRRGCLDG